MEHYLPVTAIFAIALFFCKEIVEAIKRHNSDGRKILAIKSLLSTEIEQNHWALKSLKDSISSIESALEIGLELSIVKSASGKLYFRQTFEGNLHSQRAVPAIHFSVVSKNLLDIAVLDKNLFDLASKFYDSIKELDHIREILVDFVTENDEHLDGFVHYALGEFGEIFESMSELYFECTKTNLVTHRVR